MTRLALLAALLLCTLQPSHATDLFTPIDRSATRALRDLPPGATTYAYDASLAATLMRSSASEITLNIQGMAVRLERMSVLTADGVVMQATRERTVQVPTPPHAIWKGTVVGSATSFAYLALFEDFALGYVEVQQPDRRQRLLIGPDTVIAGTSSRIVVIDDALVGTKRPAWQECHAEELPDYQRRSDSILMLTYSSRIAKDRDGTQDATISDFQIAVECNYTFFTRHERRLSFAAQYALAVMGASSAVYERDAGVRLRVPYLRIWTETDPYPGEIGDQLGGLRNVWNSTMGDVKRSSTLLLTNSGGGGLSWVGVMCGSYGYSVAGLNCGVNFPASGYIWDIDVTSHELGHAIGSSHTFNCGWNPPIDSCWNAEGGCYTGTKPRVGTIMSYCHLTSFGTALEFHPRVASLFRAVAENTPCVTREPGVMPVDVAITSIEYPPTGSTLTPGAVIRPVVYIRNIGTQPTPTGSVQLLVRSLTSDTAAVRTADLKALQPGEDLRLSISPFAITDTGSYITTVNAVVAGDTRETNNQLSRPFDVRVNSSATLQILSPNGGEQFSSGQTTTITYSSSNAGTIHIEYTTDDGLTWSTIITTVDASTGSFTWKIPPVQSTRCRVRATSLRNGVATDMSNATFTITLGKDVAVRDIALPETNATVQTPFTPKVVIRNNAAFAATDIKVRLRLSWFPAALTVHEDSITVATLAPMSEDTVDLSTTVLLPEGVHIAIASVTMTGDEAAANDEMERAWTSIGLSPPRALTVSGQHDRFVIRWQSVSDTAARISLQRQVDNGEWEEIARVSSSVNAWVDYTQPNSPARRYRLQTVINNSWSVPNTSPVRRAATFPAGLPLTAPAILSPVSAATGVPSLTSLVWSSVPGTILYHVQASSTPDFAAPFYVAVTDVEGTTSLTLPFDKSVYWRVRALNNTFNGPWSTVASFRTTSNCAENAQAFDGTRRAWNKDLVWNGGPVTVEWWQYIAQADVRNSSSFSVGQSDNVGNRFQAHAPWGDNRIYWDYGNINAEGRISTSYANYTNKWTHVALVSNGTNFKAIYLDGKLVASGQTASTPTGLTGLAIGKQVDAIGVVGQIDEFRIWKKARTQEEIASTMTTRITDIPADLVHYYRFDEGVSLATRDAGKNNRPLGFSTAGGWIPSTAPISCDAVSTASAPRIDQPVIGSTVTSNARVTLAWTTSGAEYFDVEVDTSSRFGAPLHSAYNIGTRSYDITGLRPQTTYHWRVRARGARLLGSWATGSFTTPEDCAVPVALFTGEGYGSAPSFSYKGRAVTIEYWSRVTSADVGKRSLFNVGARDENTRRFQAHAPWDNKRLYFDFGNLNVGGRLDAPIDNTIDRWAHIAMVSDGEGMMKLYVDGTEIAASGVASTVDSAVSLVIGANLPGNFLHAGSVQEFRMWNVARTREQIREHMFDRMRGPVSGLLGVWPMNDGYPRYADASSWKNTASHSTTLAWGSEPGPLARSMPVITGDPGPVKGDAVEYVTGFVDAATYEWSVSGGTVVGGQGTSAVTIRWDTVGAGAVTVIRTLSGGRCRDTVSYPLEVFLTSSVDDVTELNGVRLYPNPASQTVTVDMPEALILSVEIRSLLGETQASVVASAPTGYTLVDVSALASGRYTVIVTTPTGTRMIPLEIMR
jgi:hypothetical protein